MKLYPPIIEGTIPAFFGSTLVVPFGMNKSVSNAQVQGFSLKMKTVQSNISVIAAGTVESGLEKWDTKTNEVSFTITDDLNIGQFYKIQIAYIGEDGPGYYSTVGVVKYTSNPRVEILDSPDGKSYTGIYSQKSNSNDDIRDYNEKVYSYSFTLKDSNNNIIETSGEKLHNSSFDTELYESTDTYLIQTELEHDKIYYLNYNIKTINGLRRSASARNIIKVNGIDSKLNTKLQCTLNYENGYIDVSLVKPDGVQVEESAVGSFYLLRASDEDNFKSWREVFNFVLYGQQPSRHLWNDMTIKQGVKYKYAIQQFNTHGVRSNKIESNIVHADFEHAFLYDGKRQLKIKFNPKISSFKNTLLESKIDTIGSKHPFIFRNGNVNYKEFPISGLISYLSDENQMFNDCYFSDLDHRLTLREKNNTNFDIQNKTDLNFNNIYLERQFKLDVLEWLTNGEPKFFRSPTEGNYIIRLMNVSLTPIDSLNRMIHTFNCTAYEVAENNYSNLEKFNFVGINNTIEPELRWESVDLSKNKIKSNVNLLQHIASSIYLDDLMLGDKLKIQTKENNVNNEYTIVIGATGKYILDLDNDIQILSVSFISFGNENESYRQGLLTYSYYSNEFKDSFDIVNKIENSFIPCQQFIGQHENIISAIETVKDKIDSIGFIKFTLRNDDIEIYRFKDIYYSDREASDPMDVVDLTNIYKVNILDENKNIVDYEWLDGYNRRSLGKDCEDDYTKIIINGKIEENIDIKDSYLYELCNAENITSIQTGAAVITEICYSKKIISYDLENNLEEDSELKNKKDNYNSILVELNNLTKNSSTTRTDLKNKQDECNIAYREYCEVLKAAIQEAERR